MPATCTRGKFEFGTDDAALHEPERPTSRCAHGRSTVILTHGVRAGLLLCWVLRAPEARTSQRLKRQTSQPVDVLRTCSYDGTLVPCLVARRREGPAQTMTLPVANRDKQTALANLLLGCVILCTDELEDKVDLQAPLTRTTELELVAYFHSWLQQLASCRQAQKEVPDATLSGTAAEQAAKADTRRCLCWLLLISLMRHDPEFGSQCSVEQVVHSLQQIQSKNAAGVPQLSLFSHASEPVLAAVGKSLLRFAAEAACRGSLTTENLLYLINVLLLELNTDSSSEQSMPPYTLQAILCSDGMKWAS